jgi:hypothetical protein
MSRTQVFSCLTYIHPYVTCMVLTHWYDIVNSVAAGLQAGTWNVKISIDNGDTWLAGSQTLHTYGNDQSIIHSMIAII